MKEHITVEQLRETDLVKLSKIIKNESFDRFLMRLCLQSVPLQIKAYERMAKIITIGKLIEILEAESTSLNIQNYYNQELTWEIVVGYGMGGIEYFNKELVDALWEAVKEMLKGE